MRRKYCNAIWERFERIDEEKTKCKICGTVLKSSRSNNLKQHLQRMHSLAVPLTKQEDTSVSSTSSSICTRAISRRKYIRVKITKPALFRACVGLVTEDGIAFNTLDSKNFRAIMDPICYGLSETSGKKIRLNSSNCKNTVKVVAATVRNFIAEEVSGKLISLKIDSATRLSRIVFGVSVQFINDSKIQSRLIGMVNLKGAMASTSQKLAAKILQILDTYRISLSQIVTITSDNGANMIKTSKILSHVKDFLGDDDDDEYEYQNEESNATYCEILENFENLNESSLQLGSIQHCRCAALTAQLCALDIVKGSNKTNVLMCRNLTKFVRKSSNGFRGLFEIKGLAVPSLDCGTRWGSTYKMIFNLSQAKSILKNVEGIHNKSEDENFDMNENLWKFIEAYCLVLAPLHKIIIKFQEEQLTYSDFYIAWLKCKLVTTKMASSWRGCQ